MYIYNVTEADIDNAFMKTNSKYSHNLNLEECEPITKNKKTFKVKIGIIDSYAAGAKLSGTMFKKDGTRKRVHAACWHVFGDFIDNLLEMNPNCRIKTCYNTVTTGEENWLNFEAGFAAPSNGINSCNEVMASDLCRCNEGEN